MLRILFISMGLLFSLSSYADYAAIKCDGGLQSIELKLDETSDLKKETATLLVNGKPVSISNLTVQETEYGILGINIQHGTGPGQSNYHFENLGSNKCFGVYGSKQKGLAKVKVYKSIGMVNNANCACDQD